jgi:hypothetical protein
MYALFLFLHIATMFAVVALHSGPHVLALAAARSGPPSAVAAIAASYARSGRLVPPLGLLGAAFGIATAVAGGFDLATPWLLIAYGLFGLMILYGGAVSVPYFARLGQAIERDAPNLADLLGRRLTLVVSGDALIIVLIVADMVLKPFGRAA